MTEPTVQVERLRVGLSTGPNVMIVYDPQDDDLRSQWRCELRGVPIDLSDGLELSRWHHYADDQDAAVAYAVELLKILEPLLTHLKQARQALRIALDAVR